MRPLRLAAGGAAALVAAVAAGPVAHAAVSASSDNLAAVVYSPPAGMGTTAVEPSIGADWRSGNIMYLALQQTLRVTFDDSTAPATATWKDVSAPLTSIPNASLDPILFTDSSLGRTFVSELTGACSLMEYSDDDGASWVPSEGCGPPAGPDHQTVGAGPYTANGVPPQSTVYPDAVFYCSQAVADAQCARSDTGGLTFAPAVPAYSFVQCGGLHGHIRVSPDGTDYLPNQNCAPAPDPADAAGIFPNQGVAVSQDNGNTWSVRTLPASHATLRSDPSVASDRANTIYFGYEDAVDDPSGTQVGGHAMIASSKDHGTTWSPPVDVGSAFGIRNVTFPEVIAGDPGRAAYAFLGSTTAGNPEDTSFHGTWDLYLALTYDGGQSWTVTDVTPNDPVERDCIYLAGNGSCPSSKRNLYDFIDITADADGRVLVGYADGCTAACDAGQQCNDVCDSGPGASTSHLAQIARQSCGLGLFAKFDGTLGCYLPAGAGPPADMPEAPALPLLLLAGTAALIGGSRLRVRRARLTPAAGAR